MPQPCLAAHPAPVAGPRLAHRPAPSAVPAAAPSAAAIAAPSPATIAAPATAPHRPARPAAGRPQPEEAALIAWLLASAAGDRAAFRALYDATSPLLFPAALRMLRRRDAAEDALQETYLRVWTRAGSYQPERGPPLPWLFRILRNLVYDRIAAEQSRPTADLGDHVEAIAAPQRPPEVALDLAAGMARLAPAQRRAVGLSLFQGASASEIAARLEVPLGTAKCWLRRGLQRLRLEMAG